MEKGTGTAILELKLLMEKAHIKDQPLIQIFVDLEKAYGSINQKRLLFILEKYGVGPNICRLLSTLWLGHKLVPKLGGYFGAPFLAECRVPQGNFISKDLFNFVVDCVVCEWLCQLTTKNLSTLLDLLFYADDGHLSGFNPDDVQCGL